MNPILLVIMLSVLLTAPVKTQVVLPDQQNPTRLGRTVYGLGFAAGAGTGLGVSFRHHLPSEMSYQIVGGILKIDRNLSYDVGAEVQFDFFRGEMTRFFGGGGVAYFYTGENRNRFRGPFRLAIGVGGEFSNIQLVHITVSGMFTYFSNGDIWPLPQLGVHYYFL
jgi:hypothetical protein